MERHAGARGVAEPELTGICLDSRRVRSGDLYVAMPGTRVHGAEHTGQAVASGAAAVLTDPAGWESIRRAGGVEVPVVVVEDPRSVLGGLAAELYGFPAEHLTMIGVTGTQGKTTTTLLAQAALQRAGVEAAAIGTVGTTIGQRRVESSLTTPESPDLQGLLALIREEGVRACLMEVSSHALVLHRVDGIVFDVAVFLNLGRDHLDFHSDLEDYYAAKASLFTPERARRAVVDVDTPHGRRLAEEAIIPVRTLSTTAERGDADWTATQIRLDASGSSFLAHGPGLDPIPMRCPLPGDFNVANALAALAACAEAGLDPVPVAAAISEVDGVPGRLERVEAGQDFTVVVDYAHKPDAVAAALNTLRPLGQGRLIVVLGAGGDRDHGKRPLMGRIAAELSDLLVVTDDNPRTEDPAEIRAQLLAGAGDLGDVAAEVVERGDRREAIGYAVGRAEQGDIVLIAGKGHETGQEIRGVIHPFDDRLVAREAIAAAARSARASPR